MNDIIHMPLLLVSKHHPKRRMCMLCTKAAWLWTSNAEITIFACDSFCSAFVNYMNIMKKCENLHNFSLIAIYSFCINNIKFDIIRVIFLKYLFIVHHSCCSSPGAQCFGNAIATECRRKYYIRVLFSIYFKSYVTNLKLKHVLMQNRQFCN